MSDGSGKAPNIVQEAIVDPLAKGAQEGLEDVKQSLFGSAPKNQTQQKPPTDPKVAAKQIQDKKQAQYLRYRFDRMAADRQRLNSQLAREVQTKQAQEEEKKKRQMEVHQVEIVQRKQQKDIAVIQAKTSRERKAGGGVGG